MQVRDAIRIDAAIVRSRIAALKASFPDLVEDTEALADAIEGETDFDAVMGRIVDLFLDAVSVKEAIASRINALHVRASRFDRKADAMKRLASDLMETAGQKSIRLPEATLSIAAGRKHLVIDDENAIPQGYVRIERVPLKADISAALAAGDAIPGAHLEPGNPHLTIRTK